MSTYITQDDYLPMITDKRLTQVIESDTVLLDYAELTAISIVRDALHVLYDVDAIFSLTGTNRHPQVVRWCVTLALYFLYERVPDAVTPDRVKDNYTLTLETLEGIEDAKKSVDLPRKTVDDETVTKFRWGSQPPRGHNIN